jgi:hypothetical protein
MASTSLVVRCGFRPQVEFGAIGLDLPPDSKYAESDQGEQQQLLHGAHLYLAEASLEQAL